MAGDLGDAQARPGLSRMDLRQEQLRAALGALHAGQHEEAAALSRPFVSDDDIEDD